MKEVDYSPKYMYDQPMFMVTVNTVIIDENGILAVVGEKDYNWGIYKFPGGPVKAGQESVQFAALRHIKEQLGIVIKKDSLIPVDFRSDPDRSEEGNVVDIGFVIVLEKSSTNKGVWLEVDFEKKIAILNRDVDKNFKFSKDNQVLLKRALEIALMIKEP